MRPLVYHFNEPDVYDIDDQFMLGEWIMVAPVIKTRQRTRLLFIPAGTWFDYHNNKQIEGPGWLDIDVTLDSMPIFVRAGAVIPVDTAEGAQGVNDPNLCICYWPGQSNSTFYWDDGINQSNGVIQVEFKVDGNAISETVIKNDLNIKYDIQQMINS